MLALCVLFWSGNFVLGRYIHLDIEPLQLAFFRWGLVTLFLLPLFIKNFKIILETIKQHWFILNLLALLGITGFNTILYFALQKTTATNALLINSSVPVLILLLSFFILKSPISLKQSFGILLSTIGVIYLVLRGDLIAIMALEFSIGDLWVLAAGFAWALYTVLLKFKPKQLSDFVYFTTIVYIGLFWLGLLYFSFGYSLIQDVNLFKNYYGVFLYVSFFASVLSYYFWHTGIEKLGAAKTGQFTHLMPLFGAVLAYIFLGEVLHAYHIIGAILIGFGIYLSLFSVAHK